MASETHCLKALISLEVVQETATVMLMQSALSFVQKERHTAWPGIARDRFLNTLTNHMAIYALAFEMKCLSFIKQVSPH